MSSRFARRLAVVGGVAAGLSAAARARRMDAELEIVVFERTGYCSYTACGLPYFVGGAVEDAGTLVVRGAADLRGDDIDVRLRHEVTDVDVARRVLRVHDINSRRVHEEHFDELLIATGAAPALRGIGGDRAGVFVLRTVEDALAIDAWIRDERPRRAVIVGAGYIGLEMAEALRARGLAVAMVERAGQVLPFVGPDVARLVEDELRDKGVEVSTGTQVDAVVGDARVRGVVVGGDERPCELAIVAAGVGPDARLALAAGVETGELGGVVVNERMETSVPGVWAAGDCCETRSLVHGGPVHVPLGTTANKQGRVAGANIAGADERFRGVVGTAAVKVCGVEVGRTGLSQAEADAAGLPAVTATIEHISRARYYPGGSPLTVSMTAERGSGRLLGAQLIGREGVAKRVDVVAVALHARVGARDFSDFDLSYAPPFAPVWDPLLLAARRVAKLADSTGGVGIAA